jgi:O-antigen/teichoic acid export membrane protein
LGAEANAYFYIAWQISMLIIIFSKSISNSLFAELMLTKEDISELVKKSIKIMSTLLVCFIGGTFLFGKYVLLFFGSDYVVNSFSLLCLLVFASIPFSFNTIYVGIMRSRGDYLIAISVYGLTALLTLVGSFILMNNYGLLGVAYSWNIANIASSIMIIFMMFYARIKYIKSK